MSPGPLRWASAGVLAALLAAGPAFADQVSDLLTAGKKALGDGLYPLAAKSFRRVVEEFPDSSRDEEAAYLLGVSLFYAGKWTEAQEAFAILPAAHPRSPYASRISYWLGACSLKLGKYESALAHLAEQEGDKSAPYRLHAVLLAAAALEALGRDGDAIARLRRLLAERPPAAIAAEATFALASALYRAGKFSASRDLFSRIIIDHPRSQFVRDSTFFLAECENALGDLSEAEKRYRASIALFPDSPYREAASFRLAEISARGAKSAEALVLIDQLLREYTAGEYLGRALILKADILFDEKRYDDSLSAYRRALATLNDGTEKQSARYSMGLALLMAGRKAEAAAELEAARAGADRAVGERASFQRAFLLAGIGQDAEAVDSLSETLARFPDSASVEEAARVLASLLEKRGEEKAALARWDFLVRRFPSSPSMSEHLYRRGAALQRARRDAEALADFQRLVKEFPDSPWRDESVYSIGYIYSQRGEFSRALPYFRKIAEALPDRDIAERSAYAIGICLFNLGSFDRALESFETLRGSRPRSIGETSIVLSIGRTLYRMERLQEAAKRLREAIALSLQGETKDNAEGAEARYWLGWSLFRLNRYSEARDAFISLAELRPPDPRRPEAFFRAGICETMMNEDEEAIGYFENSLSSSPAGSFPLREQTLYELGWAFSRRGKRDESAAAFERLAREYPGGKLAAEAFFKAAAYALESKRYADALAGYKRVIREFPGSALAAQARYWSAQARLESGDARGAIDAFWLSLEAVGSGSLLPAATEGFRKSLLASGSVEMARAFVEKARASRSLPLEASASIELACAELLLGASPGEAYAIVQEVKRRMPPEPLAGEASLLAGRYYAAISDWSRALDVFSALSRSRADSVGAEAKREEARAMEASGRTAEAIEEYVKISYLFADFTDLAAEGLFNAVRVALKRGERETAIRIAGTLRANYPYSPWVAKLGELR